ncbi:MAG: flippase [Pyrinomonadaceae bacterium]
MNPAIPETPPTAVPADDETAPAAVTTSAAPSTAGMTTKVVKGSLWTLAGQVAPLAVSLVTTPFVIRMLGAESYGVLILVGLIPTYLGFADFGMSLASTKFASEAYAEGDFEKEARIVRTAALIALCSSVPIAAVLFAFSPAIISLFNVPEHLHAEASLALKFAAVTFVINFLNGIFNTPQLTRLRMDLNTLVTAGFRIAGLIATPFAVYFGGIVGGVAVLMIASILSLVGHLTVSGRLTRELFALTFAWPWAGRLLKFGGGMLLAIIAAALQGNIDKLVIARLMEPSMLAYYSVAFTFALTLTLFSQAITQSLIPAFSQLLSPDRREQLRVLFLRALRFSSILIVPVIALLTISAKPFLTIWAGKDFGEYSTRPLLILSVGLYFQAISYIFSGLLVADGRTDLIAKLFWAQLVPFAAAIAFFTSAFGIVGAAASWTLCTMVHDLAMFVLVRRKFGFSLGGWFRVVKFAGPIAVMLALPLVAAAALEPGLPWVVLWGAGFVAVYSLATWRLMISTEERSQFIALFGSTLIGRLARKGSRSFRAWARFGGARS